MVEYLKTINEWDKHNFITFLINARNLRLLAHFSTFHYLLREEVSQDHVSGNHNLELLFVASTSFLSWPGCLFWKHDRKEDIHIGFYWCCSLCHPGYRSGRHHDYHQVDIVLMLTRFAVWAVSWIWCWSCLYCLEYCVALCQMAYVSWMCHKIVI